MADQRKGDRHLPDKQLLSVRIPQPLYDELHQAAEDRDVSMAWLTARALADFLPRRPQVKRGSRRGTIAGPRPVTPTDQLPEALR